MTTIERLRLTVIREVLVGMITNKTAAVKLDLTVRQIQRLKKGFKIEGADFLIHGSRGKQGSRKTKVHLEKSIVNLITDKYHDFGPLLAYEKIKYIHNINLGKDTIRQIMIRNNIWKPKKRRRSQYFTWRERRSSYGELEQFDGSYYNWFEGRNPNLPEACLLASIDDATGKITHTSFGTNESVEAVFTFWNEYVKKNGIPTEIYLDKFSTYKINHKEATDNIELMTQFQRAMKSLGTKLIHAHTPQAKGRVERLFGTLQDRLVKEMRLAHIHTIDKANIFLRNTFIPWFNNHFAVIPRSPENCHRTLDSSTTHELDSVFAKHYTRTINNDFTIQYKTKWYQLKEIQPTTIFKKEKVLIEDRLNNTIKIKYKNHYLYFFELPTKQMKVQKSPVILTGHKSNWRPPEDHPWRQYAY